MVKCIALLVVAVACSNDEAPTGDTPKTTDNKPVGSEPAAKDSAARKALVEAWEKAGFKATEMKSASAFGKDCKATTINSIDVVVCEHPSADEAKKAEAEALVWIGNTTGAAWSAGTLVIAAADRKKVEPTGTTINSLMKSTPPK